MDRPAIFIRQFRADEAEAWRDIRLTALEENPEAFGQTWEHAVAQPIEQFRQTVAGEFPPFAAFAGDVPVGTAGFYVMSGPKLSHRGQLWGMYVAPAQRRTGLGASLIEAVIAHARDETPVEQIHLHVVTTNTAAYGLYRKMRFEAYGIEPRALCHQGRYYDETLMVRHLTRGDGPE